jgi:ring-1,2-phenylacetyl-CoA epoxidase subunit PaaD
MVEDGSMETLTADQVWQALEEVKDPELPVVSVVEMGIVRAVFVSGNAVIITMTPTFSGCPALAAMKTDIEARVRLAGAKSVQVKTVLAPPWTSDWITDAAREKLLSFGLAPPPRHAGHWERLLSNVAACPYCGSQNTTLKNSFGPTLCRALYYCNNCQQPFEQFKPI